jgi:hypothetical protein
MQRTEGLVFKSEQTRLRLRNYLCLLQAGEVVQITNKLAYWLLDRYFERVLAFLQRHAAKIQPKASLQAHDKTVR